MDGRFLIYEGFENDAEGIFEKLISKFRFDVTSKSDSGISLDNNRVKLEISYDTGIQIWLKVKRFDISEMIAKLCMIKGASTYQEFKNLMFSTLDTKESKRNDLKRLSQFLVDHFTEELSEL